jgi:ferredoxin, 2Fe-2S
MPVVKFVATDGNEVCLEASLGQSVMLVALQNGVDGIDAECGGSLACGTCHVYVDAAWLSKLPAASDVEDALLDDVACPRTERSRLACQLAMTAELDGLKADIPERQS